MYAAIFVYIQSIKQDEYGEQKSCCFCLSSRRSEEKLDKEELLKKDNMDDIEKKTLNSESDVILRVEGLTKAFDGYKAVDDVHFEVLRNEFLVILGQSGSGKSSIVNMLSGL